MAGGSVEAEHLFLQGKPIIALGPAPLKPHVLPDLAQRLPPLLPHLF
jgi:hypothetical protein